MKRYCFALCFLCLFVPKASFCQLENLNLSDQFRLGYEISSLFADSIYVYLPAEKCKKILLIKIEDLNKHSYPLRPSDSIVLQSLFPTLKVEIEGIACYNGHLLMTDELNATIWDYDIQKKRIRAISISGKDLSHDTGEQGMEGIGIDSANKLCYILKERDENNSSTLHVFNLKDDSGISLQFKNDIRIIHPSSDYRYLDLYFDNRNKCLLLLKSKYVGPSSNKNSYSVDKIYFKFYSGGDFYSAKLSSIPLQDEIQKIGSHGYYSTNLEGLCVHWNDLLLVTDNVQTDKECCRQLQKSKTMLLRLSNYQDLFKDITYQYAPDSSVLTIISENDNVDSKHPKYLVELRHKWVYKNADSVRIVIKGKVYDTSTIHPTGINIRCNLDICGNRFDKRILTDTFNWGVTIPNKDIFRNPNILLKGNFSNNIAQYMHIGSVDLARTSKKQ